MPKRGLPTTVKMRHDAHYVETLTASAGAPLGRIIAIDRVDPNPYQPRQLMGDLSELMASIAEKGIIEPLVVRQLDDRYQIVAGERRYQAAVQLGLTEIPIVIRDVDDVEIMEIALVENLQRKDLTPFEEADALATLIDRSSYTHDQLAQRLGKSRTSITESLSLTNMPDEVRNLCRLADITAKSLLLQVVRLDGRDKMVAFIEQITRSGPPTRQIAREAARKPARGRPKAFTYTYRPPTKSFNLKMSFKKSQVDEAEIISALEEILAELRAQRRKG